MKQLRFDDLYSPEYYFEIPGHDARIAIMKFIDARDTMGMADFSLSYVGDEETTELEKNFVRTIHLRHAIEDLNSSFDLLLQIPWFYYRIWEDYNQSGNLREIRLKNKEEITRNTSNWVETAEKSCEKKKVTKYFNSVQNILEQKIDDFWNTYIENMNKPFTVRSLCNSMKHNHALAFEELYEPYEFNINIDGQTQNLRQSNLSLEFHQDIMEQIEPTSTNPTTQQNKVGQVNYYYNNDLYVDIEYVNSDRFNFKDCTHEGNRLKISEVYKECCDYFDALVSLFEDMYKDIYPQISLLESFIGKDGKPNIKSSPTNIDLNKYFSNPT